MKLLMMRGVAMGEEQKYDVTLDLTGSYAIHPHHQPVLTQHPLQDLRLARKRIVPR